MINRLSSLNFPYYSLCFGRTEESKAKDPIKVTDRDFANIQKAKKRYLCKMLRVFICLTLGGVGYNFLSREQHKKTVSSQANDFALRMENQSKKLGQEILDLENQWEIDEKNSNDITQRFTNLLSIVDRLDDKVNKRSTLELIEKTASKVDPWTVSIEGGISYGSGVILKDISKNRYYILTVSHLTQYNAIIQKGKQVYRIKLYNGNDSANPIEFYAGITRLADGSLADSPKHKNNLTLLDIPPEAVASLPTHLKPVLIRNIEKDPLKVGEVSIAIGRSMEMRDEVSAGIISNTQRDFTPRPTKSPFPQYSLNNQFQENRDQKTKEEGFVATDASLNTNSDGGGLFDLEGRLIGINAFKRINTDGIGGAIPIETITKTLKTWGVFINGMEKE